MDRARLSETAPLVYLHGLPGGAFAWDGGPALVAELCAAHPFLDGDWAARLVRLYGTEAAILLSGARVAADLGEDFVDARATRGVVFGVQPEIEQRELELAHGREARMEGSRA